MKSTSNYDQMSDLFDRLLGLDRKAEIGLPAEISSFDDVHRYLEALSARRVEDDRRLKIWRLLKRVILILALAAMFSNYYFLEVYEKIMSLPYANFIVVGATVKKNE